MVSNNHSLTGDDKTRGFTLIECLVAMVITTVGLLAAAGLITVGIRLQAESRNAIAATAIGKSKAEELQNYAPTAIARARGGSLTTNISGYSDVPDPRFVRRWLIETAPTDPGVPAGMQRIWVTVIPNRRDVQFTPVEITVLVPSS